MSRKNFILVATDGQHTSGARATGLEIATRRIKKGEWPLYHNTRNKYVISRGDRLLVYIGGIGPHRGHLILSSRVGGILKKLPYDKMFPDGEDIISEPAEYLVLLDKNKTLKEPVMFKEVLPYLDCKPSNMKKWGVIMFGGVRSLTDHDYEKIVSWKPGKI